jgi:DNA-binding NarL/FixJ family response regulator
MKTRPTIRNFSVLIADDHQIIRRALSSLISELWPSVIITYASMFKQALKKAKKFPSLIIIDINFPGGQNIKIIDELKKIQADAKILVFSSLKEKSYAIPYLLAGASGFLAKTASESEILTAITTIVSGGRYFGADLNNRTVENMLPARSENPFHILSDRELKVAELLAKGMRVKEISMQFDLRIGTVSTYKARAFKKLKVKDIIGLAKKIEIYR